MARYGKEHTAETRRRILDAAGRRFKADGLDGSGIAVLMSDAGLSNGAFYAHFASKADLVEAVVSEQLAGQLASFKELSPGRAGVAELIRLYLSPGHRDHPASGCPSAALLDEIARCPPRTRHTYAAGMSAIVDEMALRLAPADPSSVRGIAASVFAMMVGTLQMARAHDGPSADALLSAGARHALELLGLDPAW
jgi:TetR/AcrR family transcriptional repressor of nem operon